MIRFISFFIASINIAISAICYASMYLAFIENTSVSSKGIGEYFTLISSIIFIINGICLASIIKTNSENKKYFTIIPYVLIGIIPLGIQNYHLIIPTGVCSFVVMNIYVKLITTLTDKHLIILNLIALVMNTTWYMLFIGF